MFNQPITCTSNSPACYRYSNSNSNTVMEPILNVAKDDEILHNIIDNNRIASTHSIGGQHTSKYYCKSKRINSTHLMWYYSAVSHVHDPVGLNVITTMLLYTYQYFFL